MKVDSRTTIHAGVNFNVFPFGGLDQSSSLKFQATLLDMGVAMDSSVFGDKEIRLVREKPTPLQVRVAVIGPNIGQLLIVAPTEIRSLEFLEQESVDIVEAFSKTWPTPQRQILSCDSTIRDLYETSTEHAFSELWEKRLRQSPDGLRWFERLVLGGGMRFVMPPASDDPREAVVEVKIESYLQNTSRLFLEVTFAWQRPESPEQPMNPTERLKAVDEYIRHQVVQFIQEGQA